MPIRRRGDGEIVNEKTEVVRDQVTKRRFQPASDSTADLPTELIKERRVRESLFDRDENEGAGSRTRIYRPGDAGREGETDSVGTPARDAMDDPPTGWLVVVRGPGQGRVLTLGSGMNAIGRGEVSRVRLDFGDDSVSRENHARLIYEPRQRGWFLNHGDGTNLTYMNGDLVVGTVEVDSGSEIQIGETILRFQAFCRKEFDWSDVGD